MYLSLTKRVRKCHFRMCCISFSFFLSRLFSPHFKGTEIRYANEASEKKRKRQTEKKRNSFLGRMRKRGLEKMEKGEISSLKSRERTIERTRRSHWNKSSIGKSSRRPNDREGKRDHPSDDSGRVLLLLVRFSRSQDLERKSPENGRKAKQSDVERQKFPSLVLLLLHLMHATSGRWSI